MKKLMLAAALAALAAASSNAVLADWTPPGPIKMMIAFKAGGGADTQARMIAEALEARHGWKIIPEQMTGKGGAVLAAALKDEPADGTVIGILVTESLGYNMLAAKNAGLPPVRFHAADHDGRVPDGRGRAHLEGLEDVRRDDRRGQGRAGDPLRRDEPQACRSRLSAREGAWRDFNIVMVRGGKGVMNGLNAGDLDAGWARGSRRRR